MPLYTPDSEVVSTEISDEEAVLLSLDTQTYYSLNETGRRIWEMLSSGEDPEAIATAITQEWEIPREEALESVHSFLRELHEEGLVEMSAEESQ